MIATRRFVPLLLVAALIAGACGTGAIAPSPTPSRTPSVTVSPSGAGELEVTLFFLGDTLLGLRLFSEVRTIPGDEDPALAALRALLDGGIEPLDPDHVSPWATSGSRVRSLTRSAEEAVLDIELGRLNVGAEGEQRAIEQLLWTAVYADPEIEALRITVDGEPVETLAGHVDATVAFTLGPDDEALAPVVVTEPQEGAEVPSPVTVRGEACTFEANVAWELLDEMGARIDGGSTLAAEACPVRSPWSVDLGDLAPGTYTIRAAEYSAKDGALVVEDTKTFTVAG